MIQSQKLSDRLASGRLASNPDITIKVRSYVSKTLYLNGFFWNIKTHISSYPNRDTDDDIPQGVASTIQSLSPLLYQHLLNNVLSKTTKLRAIVEGTPNGDGYAALRRLLQRVHPTYVKIPKDMVRQYPNQDESETIKGYFKRFVDHLQLVAYISNNVTTLANIGTQNHFLSGAKRAVFLHSKCSILQSDPTLAHEFTAKNFLSTVVSILDLPNSPVKLPPTPIKPEPTSHPSSWKRNRTTQFASCNSTGTSSNPIPVNNVNTAAPGELCEKEDDDATWNIEFPALPATDEEMEQLASTYTLLARARGW
ncbi:unnamed protein product [Cylindrotheca closterium]|uniref:Uncharacterized protein n=1 Tax=Cylindrotheca closterium TaxID=2856 RepID=A0AAD2FRF2_9STRA|nr:unnamed protein product [Cylindrotheca closterium]CAJ1950430.1 unnamed protein product [Cylindrotheca closterium]CAJ1950432.1 unnamed protein product [Cylindrotheca closterium]